MSYRMLLVLLLVVAVAGMAISCKATGEKKMAGKEKHQMAGKPGMTHEKMEMAGKEKREMAGKPGMTHEGMAMAGKPGMTHEKMHGMGMSEGMMMRRHALMDTRIESTDPEALLVMKDHLKLTDDQAAKLDTIAKKAREDSGAVLTDEQKNMLKPMEGTPDTMTGMMKAMPKHEMHEGKGGKKEMTSGADSGATYCPICGGFMEKSGW